PLRERKRDVLELFLAFAERYRSGSRPRVSATFVESLCSHDWPRNVRQLRQLAERLSAQAGHKPEWRRRDLQAALPELGKLVPSAPPATPSAPPDPPLVAAIGRPPNRAALLEALSAASGNVTVAARALSISKQTLYKYVALVGIDLSQLRDSGTPPKPDSRH
ncbi:MAG: helix-turn-helix domain-containing protein, partial [Polyangiaceae bacterium]